MDTAYSIDTARLLSAVERGMFGSAAVSEDRVDVLEYEAVHFVQLLFVLQEARLRSFTERDLLRLIDAVYASGHELVPELADEAFKARYPEEVRRFTETVCVRDGVWARLRSRLRCC